LHISEFGYTCAKYPEKAQEIITGSLNTVDPGQMIFIESTARGREGKFYDICRQAMGFHGDLTPLDYKFFFFPWHDNPEYSLKTPVYLDQETQDYFLHVEKECSKSLTQEQKYWYFKKRATQGDDMQSEYPSYPEEAFKASMEGSYYGKLVDQSYADKRITKVPWDPRLYVDTWWDLGVGDETAIIFTQTFNQEIRVIDCYSASGEGLTHYGKILQSKPYIYGTHTGPHDINVRELGTGKSRRELAWGIGLNFRVAKKLPVDDGIEAVRMLFPRLWIDEEKCGKFIEAISHYKKEWDEDNATFKKKPLHDWSSHYSDSLRVLGVSYMGVPGWVRAKEKDQPIIDEQQIFDRYAIISEL